MLVRAVVQPKYLAHGMWFFIKTLKRSMAVWYPEQKRCRTLGFFPHLCLGLPPFPDSLRLFPTPVPFFHSYFSLSANLSLCLIDFSFQDWGAVILSTTCLLSNSMNLWLPTLPVPCWSQASLPPGFPHHIIMRLHLQPPHHQEYKKLLGTQLYVSGGAVQSL